jgi:putative membrane protein
MAVRDYSEAQRLHPLTLVQRILVSIPGLVLLMIPFLTSPDQNAWTSLIFAIIYGVIAFPLIILRYLRFRFQITSKEITIQSGVITRTNRSIPIERIHNIEIEQTLLPRLLGTAKVKIETAGSSTTEGVLEYVSLKEARNIRQVVRAYQKAETPVESERQREVVGSAEAETEPPNNTDKATEYPKIERLVEMPFSLVVLSGAYRFSLLYILLFFSGLQYVDVGPEEIVYWFERGPLQGIARFAAESPVVTVLVTIVTAAFLSWVSGIAVNINRFYRFRLSLEGDKLHRSQGLLTVSETTIPLKKVQAVVLRTNVLMRHLGWWQMQVQTMGLNEKQRGYEVVVPFARMDEIRMVMERIGAPPLPDEYLPVARLHVRRVFVRYAFLVVTATLATAYFWPFVLWGLTALGPCFYLAVLDYRNHGYRITRDTLYIRKGIIRHHVWVIPIHRCQAFIAGSSFFQRRLGLKSFLVDTAGAGTFAYAEVDDVTSHEADQAIDDLYDYFQSWYTSSDGHRSLTPPAVPAVSTARDTAPQEPSSEVRDLEGQ